ncbi:MAG: XdhC family protein [Saprospiraceae bacterium]
MELWQFIKEKLEDSQDVLLLCVLYSEGSSPGRQGFKMAVAQDGSFSGTIGGGIMEHKLVEKARQMFQNQILDNQLIWQHHDKEKTKDRSGMICSGSQLNAFVHISKKDLLSIEQILEGMPCFLTLNASGIHVHNIENRHSNFELSNTDNNNWTYVEKLNAKPKVHIFGGGHVSLALSELLAFLDFEVIVYDDRKDLSTLEQNTFANKKIIIPDYLEIGQAVQFSKDDFVIIMTIGFRTDKIVLRQLLNENVRYLGMLGSQHKTATLLKELQTEGFCNEQLAKIKSPIGLNIHSKTSREIAVSIAAEIIANKNS